MQRRALLASALTLAATRSARAKSVGITESEILIGHTCPYSGPASSYAPTGKSLAAYFAMINDQGGIEGRKITFISRDDGYVPAQTVEQTRRLVENDGVAAIVGSLGTPQNSAIRPYLNQAKVPHLFLMTGAEKWADHQHFPWTMGMWPSNRVEAQVYGKYVLAHVASPKVAVLYQNDDFGKDFLLGLQDVFGARYDELVVKQSYDTAEPTIDSQIVSLQATGANAFVSATTPRPAAQAIRKAYDIGWKPLYFQNNNNSSVASIMKPAGVEKGVGILSAIFRKDVNDPAWTDDPGIKTFWSFMDRYLPGEDRLNSNFAAGWLVGSVFAQVLRQCGRDVSRDRLMREATHLSGLTNEVLLPGITVNTSPTNYRPIRQLQLARFDGHSWRVFGDLIEGANV